MSVEATKAWATPKVWKPGEWNPEVSPSEWTYPYETCAYTIPVVILRASDWAKVEAVVGDAWLYCPHDDGEEAAVCEHCQGSGCRPALSALDGEVDEERGGKP